MTFSGKINSAHQAQVLINSGASHNFSAAKYVAEHKLQVIAEKGEVACAGGVVAAEPRDLQAFLKLQGYQQFTWR